MYFISMRHFCTTHPSETYFQYTKTYQLLFFFSPGILDWTVVRTTFLDLTSANGEMSVTRSRVPELKPITTLRSACLYICTYLKDYFISWAQSGSGLTSLAVLFWSWNQLTVAFPSVFILPNDFEVILAQRKVATVR